MKLKPFKLKSKDVVGIFAPSSPIKNFSDLENGIKYLEKNGLRVEVGKCVYKRINYLAGGDIERANELNSMFENKNIKAIFAARGGYGVHRILDKLNYNVIKKNPKIVCGFSDITALQFALWKKCKLVSLSSPLVVEFAKKMKGNVENYFWEILTSTNLKNINYEINAENIDEKQIDGILIGGNLTLISSLCGTKFFPNLKNAILFLEDVSEEIYRIDRMIQHLKHANVFNFTKAILLGNFFDCKLNGKKFLEKKLVKEFFLDFRKKTFWGLQHGHIQKNLPIPNGLDVHIFKNKLVLKESFVI